MIFINNFDRILLCGVNSYQQRRKCGLGLHKHTNDPNTVYVIFSSEVEPNEKLPWERSLQIISSFRGKGGNLYVLRLLLMYFNQKRKQVLQCLIFFHFLATVVLQTNGRNLNENPNPG